LRSALEWISFVGKTKVFGFFILASRASHAKSAIRGRYHVEDGSKIEEMRAREIQFKEKLALMFADPEKVAKYYDFSANFWNKF
jgi:hypothetical protein